MGKQTALLLGFDLGASSGRAVLGRFDGEQIILEEVHRFPNEPVRVNSALYWDLLRLWQEIKTGLKKALATGEEPSSIGVDTWGVDYGLLNQQGRLLANPYHYRDQRTSAIMPQVVQELGAEYLYERTGIQIVPFNTIFQLAAELQANCELVKLTDQVLLMPDLFNYYLSGVPAAEYSIASTTGLLNIRSRDWDQELLEKIGFPPGKLPSLISPGTKLGSLTSQLCQELGCRPFPVVAVAGHDTASAVAATPLKEGEAFLSSGTWSLMGVERKKPVVTSVSRKYNFTNEGGVGYTVRLLKNIIGLWLIQECRRIWRQVDPGLDYATISQLAAQAPPFKSIINPAAQRFFAPLNMVAEVQQFCRETGQEVPGGIGAVARCIYQSLALEYRYGLEQLEEITGEKLRGLRIVGGGSQDELLSQLTADALAIPVSTGPVEATALGNVVVQAMSMGLIKGLNDARALIERTYTGKIYQPHPDQSWETAYRKYRTIVETVL